MSSALAILASMLLFAAVLAPLALAFFRKLPGRPVVIGYGGLAILVGAYQAGLGEIQPIATIDTGNRQTGRLTLRQCSDLIAALEEGRVIVDRRNPSRLVVARSLWEQLPGGAQDATLNCVERGRSGAAGSAPIQLVLQ